MPGIGQRGFTLIEVIVGLAILMVAMTGVFTIYSWSMTEVRRARYRTLVTHCAGQMLEMIVSSPDPASAYHGFTSTSMPPTGNCAGDDLRIWQGLIQDLPLPVTGRITVLDDPTTPYSTLVTITMTYENYGRKTTLAVSRKTPSRSP